MNFILDDGLPESLGALLRAAGHESDTVSSLGLAQATDAEILRRAREIGAVVVTLDTDFGGTLAADENPCPSVVRFLRDGLQSWEYSDILQSIATRHVAELSRGASILVQARTIPPLIRASVPSPLCCCRT